MKVATGAVNERQALTARLPEAGIHVMFVLGPRRQECGLELEVGIVPRYRLQICDIIIGWLCEWERPLLDV